MLLQVMIDFQAAEKKRLEEPASEIGLEPLCAMVSFFFFFFLSSVYLLFELRIVFSCTSVDMRFDLTLYLD